MDKKIIMAIIIFSMFSFSIVGAATVEIQACRPHNLRIGAVPDHFQSWSASPQGNESILYGVSNLSDAEVRILPKNINLDPIVEEHCLEFDNITDLCIDSINYTYYYPPNLTSYASQIGSLTLDLPADLDPVTNDLNYPLYPELDLNYHIGESSIVIEGDTNYNSTDTNITQEPGFAHLNISDSSMVGYYPFDINSSPRTYDYTDNDNEGILNGPVWISNGFIGGAQSFNADYVEIGDNPTIDMTTELSVSAWIKRLDTGTQRSIVTKWDYQTQGSWSFLIKSSGEIKGSIPDSLSSSLNNDRGQTTNANMVIGQWYHVAMVYNGSETGNADRLKLYVDGVQKSLAFKGTIVSALQDSTASIKIGKFGGTRDDFYRGDIDEVMIFNRALSAADVANIHTNQSSRYDATGEMLFKNLDLETGVSVDIDLTECTTRKDSQLRAKINNGAFQNFSTCFIDDYDLTGIPSLTNANLTIGFLSGTPTTKFWSPLIIGNITLDVTLPPPPQQQTENITQEPGFNHLNISDPTIVAYFPWDPHTNPPFFVDYSDNSHDGSASGNPAFNATGGFIGGVYELDGVADKLKIDPVLLSLDSTTVGTIAAWVKPVDGTPASQEFIMSFTDADTVNEGIFMAILSSGIFRIQQVQAGGTVDWRIDTAFPAFSDNSWTHVAMVQDSILPKIYIDGIALPQSTKISNDLTVWFNDLVDEDAARIGDRILSNAESDFFDGSVDEVMIYNTNLSAAQVNALYSNTSERFFKTGVQVINNQDLSALVSPFYIRSTACQTYQNTTLKAQINNGSIEEFVNCEILAYDATGIPGLGDANVSIYFASGPSTNGFYSPITIGNLTITGFVPPPVVLPASQIIPNTPHVTPHIKLGENLVFT